MGRAQRRSQFSRTSVASYGCPRETVATRLFGSAPRSDGNDIPGKIFLSDEQDSLKNIDLKRIEKTVYDIRTLIGYKTYDVNVFLIDDNEMREVNKESRNIDGPTDILSFPFHEAIKPGEIELPRFDIPDYYALGDMLIDVPYVLRICKEDKEENTGLTDVRDETCERGVSGAMSKVYDPQVRMEMLLVHGMLHLVGYDHENDDEHIEMASREEEILAALRLGA